MWLTNVLCRTQGTVMPFGTAGIMVKPPWCHPVLMVTIWNVVCLLWTYYIMKMRFSKKMSYRSKKKYLVRMLNILADKITIVEVNRLKCPSTLNLTISVKKRKIVQIMFGASIHSRDVTDQ